MILQNIWRRAVVNIMVDISLSNIFRSMLLPARFQQDYEAALGRCERQQVKGNRMK